MRVRAGAHLVEVALGLGEDRGGVELGLGRWICARFSQSLAPSVLPVCVLLSFTTAQMSPACASVIGSCDLPRMMQDLAQPLIGRGIHIEDVRVGLERPL